MADLNDFWAIIISHKSENDLSMSDYPLVSILVIHYNRLHTLKECIEYARKNIRYPNLEYVISDDGSPENVIEAIRSLPFDKYVFAEKNAGLGANTNKGLAACKGEYIFQIQDDHFILAGFEDFVEKAIRVLQHEKNMGLVRALTNKDFDSFIMAETKGISYRIIDKPIWKNGYNGFHQHSELPHFKHRSYHEKLGYYTEGTDMIYMENEFSIRFLNAKGYRLFFLKGYSNIFHHATQYSFRPGIYKGMRDTGIAAKFKKLLKKTLPFLRMLRFYFWMWKYDPVKRRY